MDTEAKRRIRAVGAIPARASARRLITIALEVTDVWDDRRHLNILPLLKSTPDAPL
ncbi:hypothetical protein [Myxococcus sp. AM010]|uniref:hypothetical protein n=1 Tax=Myxococcus sp. AM010 TaxID=2745138 RepID=UPI00159627B2|nr:hypothetical protein [Myxococcus sp. AM010]NVJ15838.1 hypothetical protein [Myxococcus sp. AM010]